MHDISRFKLSGAFCRRALFFLFTSFAIGRLAWPASAADTTPKIPRFTIENMDKSVKPDADFFRYAAGAWLKNSPVPADKARWSGFDELQERNWQLIHGILEDCAAGRAGASKAARLVGDFFVSAMDTNRLEQLGFQPLEPEFQRIAALRSADELLRFVAEQQHNGVSAMFGASVGPDAKNSAIYAYCLSQGGLGLPERDYYLSGDFAEQREAYVAHITKMFSLLGEKESDAAAHAKTVLDLETALAKASKSRTDLRDPIANYHKFTVGDLPAKYPALTVKTVLQTSGLDAVKEIVIRQPEFFSALESLVKERPLADWKTYLRWHVVRNAAPYLHQAAEDESFAFYGTVLRGQPAQEPRWQRAAKVIDGEIGEALGELFVQKYYPPEAKARMNELIENLKAVFRDRLAKVAWMTDATRTKAQAKFDRFTQKIGHPDKFRDYSTVEIRRDDFFGNVKRASVCPWTGRSGT